MPSRLLLVDDDPACRLALSELLQRRISEVLVDTAPDVHAALDLLRQRQYHVVLSDIRMAGLDGLALLNQVRERWPTLPVILMTAEGRRHEAEGLQKGAVAFLEKPLDLDQLVSTVRTAIDQAVLEYRVREANIESLSHTQLESERMGFYIDPSLNRP